MRRSGSGTAWRWAGAAALLQLPFLELGVSFYDEGSILAVADGLRQGEVLYRDRVTTLAPLTYELLGWLFRGFGPHLLIARALQAVIFVLCTLLVHRILRDFVSDRWAGAGALTFLALKPLAFPFWTELNYAQLAMLLTLTAVVCVHRFLSGRRLLWLGAAGLATGLTMITKQNLGAFLGLSIALALVLDSFLQRERAVSFLRRGVVTLGAALLPILATGLYYAAQGAAMDLLDQAVFRAPSMQQAYRVPLPSLRPWALGTHDLGKLVFTYFPAPVIQLAWTGGLDLYSKPTTALIEHAVKAIYYVPLLALLIAAPWLVRRLRAQRLRADRIRWTLLLGLVATSYGGLYRADWTHLMNIYPPLLILTLVVLERGARRLARLRTLAQLLLALWIGAAVLVAATTFAIYRVPIETERGRLLAPPAEAEFARHVLGFLETQPRSARILILRSDPLFYFLAARRVPTRVDLVRPGLVTPAEDVFMAQTLDTIDTVMFNPSVILTLPQSLSEYAPKTAARLAREFRSLEPLHDSALLLRRPPRGAPREEVVLDVWERLGTPEAAGAEEPPERTSWLIYRVLATRIRALHPPSCFRIPHRITSGESVSAVLLSPRDFGPRSDELDSSVVFRVRVLEPGSEPRTLSELHVSRRSLPRWSHVPLGEGTGEGSELEFCMQLIGKDAWSEGEIRVGWGELQIVREIGGREHTGPDAEAMLGERCRSGPSAPMTRGVPRCPPLAPHRVDGAVSHVRPVAGWSDQARG